VSDPALRDFAERHGLARAGEVQTWTQLSGGVSCEVWRLDAGGRPVCLKRALGKLKVAADWRAPINRSLYEFRWFETVRAILPVAVPEPLACDPDAGVLAMAYVPGPVWKTELLAGHIDVAFAREVGLLLGRIHAATANDAQVADRFLTDGIFFALRLDPFLLTAAERQPQLAAPLRALAERTAATKRVLVHGDVSPKNILMAASGPVFLDAETAWFGDPAFDLAFCLNHLLLKQLAVPAARSALAESFAGLAEAYLAQVDWEPPADVEARAASLLPALSLARVDGKSPVEYLPAPEQKDAVRAFAAELLSAPVANLGEVMAAWSRILASRSA